MRDQLDHAVESENSARYGDGGTSCCLQSWSVITDIYFNRVLNTVLSAGTAVLNRVVILSDYFYFSVFGAKLPTCFYIMAFVKEKVVLRHSVCTTFASVISNCHSLTTRNIPCTVARYIFENCSISGVERSEDTYSISCNFLSDLPPN